MNLHYCEKSVGCYLILPGFWHSPLEDVKGFWHYVLNFIPIHMGTFLSLLNFGVPSLKADTIL